MQILICFAPIFAFQPWLVEIRYVEMKLLLFQLCYHSLFKFLLMPIFHAYRNIHAISCVEVCWGAKKGVAIHGQRHEIGFSTVILAKQYIFLSILFSKKVKSFLFKKGISKMSTLAIDFTLLISTGVTAFYVVLYVNFGAILDWQKIKIIVKKPIEPCLGFFCNFIFLPLVRKRKFWNSKNILQDWIKSRLIQQFLFNLKFSYVLGLLLFSDDDEMRFSLFASGWVTTFVRSFVEN